MKEGLSLYRLEDTATNIKCIGSLMESLTGNPDIPSEAKEEAAIYLNKMLIKETDRILLIMKSNLKNNL